MPCIDNDNTEHNEKNIFVSSFGYYHPIQEYNLDVAIK